MYVNYSKLFSGDFPYTVYILKISNTSFHTFLAQILLFIQLFPKKKKKKSSGITNTVDPDQTAPSGAV